MSELSEFLLTRPSRGATLAEKKKVLEGRISTHTPLAGRDHAGIVKFHARCHFYSHAPRGARPAASSR